MVKNSIPWGYKYTTFYEQWVGMMGMDGMNTYYEYEYLESQEWQFG